MLIERPYFKENKEWYIENKDWYINGVPWFSVKGAKKPKGNQYILTDKAPQKAIDSYNRYYEILNKRYDIEDEK